MKFQELDKVYARRNPFYVAPLLRCPQIARGDQRAHVPDLCNSADVLSEIDFR